MKSRYTKIRQFSLYQRAMQESDLDVLTLISSPKGFGKSNFILASAIDYIEVFGLFCPKCQHEWIFTGKALTHNSQGELTVKDDLHQPCPKCNNVEITKSLKFNVGKYLAYDNDDVRKLVYDLPPYSPILADEGVRFMMAEDWNLAESKDMKKLFAQMRTKHLLVYSNIPKFIWVDRKYRNDMATFWVRILKRGIALLLQPDLSEVEDSWHMKDFQKLLGSYNYFTSEEDLLNKANRLKSKHPCVFDYFKIPKIPQSIYNEYLELRDKKAFERTQSKTMIDQRQLLKVGCYNLVKNWDEFRKAIEDSRVKRPTYKMIANILLQNPKTKKELIKPVSIHKYIKDINSIVES